MPLENLEKARKRLERKIRHFRFFLPDVFRELVVFFADRDQDLLWEELSQLQIENEALRERIAELEGRNGVV